MLFDRHVVAHLPFSLQGTGPTPPLSSLFHSPHALMLVERLPLVVMSLGQASLGGSSTPVYAPPGQ